LEAIDIQRIVKHVCDLLRPEAAARKIEIAATVQDSLPQVMGDGVRLTQALLNLVINALQAVERDGRIEVRASASSEALSLEVADSGPGIPAERLAAIFDPYFTTKAEGSGLGLWIAQQIVTAHGGTLRAQNGAGGGAVFAVRLPLKRAG
jgi:two-component system sensor histidine kinase HydH